ncbi:MAG: hypothetical protein ACK4N1_04865 [Pseudorhizobium sp.]
MSKTKGIEDELADLSAALVSLDGDITQAAQDIAAAAHDRSVLDVTGSAPAKARFDAIAQAWTPARQRLVSLVLAVADRNDEAMAPLEDKPQPRLSERIRAALANVISLRWIQPAGPKARSLGEALSLADGLYGMLLARREKTIALRHAIESDLVEMIGHRAQMAQNVVSAAEEEDRETSGVSLQVEDSLQAVQDLTMNLNGQVRDMNALINKLALEAERAIVLASVLAGEGTAPASDVDKSLLSHLRPLIELFENDMLSSIEIERRRGRVDALFQAAFDDAGNSSTSRALSASDIQEAQNA